MQRRTPRQAHLEVLALPDTASRVLEPRVPDLDPLLAFDLRLGEGFEESFDGERPEVAVQPQHAWQQRVDTVAGEDRKSVV